MTARSPERQGACRRARRRRLQVRHPSRSSPKTTAYGRRRSSSTKDSIS
jgi:hypothetical protein